MISALAVSPDFAVVHNFAVIPNAAVIPAQAGIQLLIWLSSLVGHFLAGFRSPQRGSSYFSLLRQEKVTKEKATPM